MKQTAIFLFLGISLAGCYPNATALDGQVGSDALNGTSTGGTSTGGTSSSSTVTAGGATVTSTVTSVSYKYAACTAPYAHLAAESTVAELTTLLPGDWYQCETKSALCTQDEMGLHINTDGTWTKLFADAAGNITEASASAKSSAGTWGFADNSVNGLYFSTASDGYSLAAWFVEGGQVMVLSNFPCAATYVKSTGLDYAGVAHNTLNGVPVEPNAIPSVTIDSATLAQCDANKNNFDTTSLVTMQQSLDGVWMLCPSSSTGCAEGEVGLQIDSAGNWSRLYADSTGALYAGLGALRRGTYDLGCYADAGICQIDSTAFGIASTASGAAERGTYSFAVLMSGVTRFDANKAGFSKCPGYYQKVAP